MSGRLYSLITVALLAGILGTGIYGAMTFTAFHNWRKASLLRDAYEKAKKRPDRRTALNQLILGPEVDPDLKGLYTPVPELKDQYVEARDSNETAALDEFFKKHILPSRWVPWLCVLGFFLGWPVLSKIFQSLFEKYTGRMLFIMILIGSLGGYFAFLAGNNIFPLGIDLAGGTELIYALDYGDVDRRISSVIKKKDEVEAQKGQKDAKGELIDDEYIRKKFTNVISAMTESKKTAPEKATEVVRKRIDPTGTKGIPITQFGTDRLRIQLPKASPEDVERLKHAINTQGRLTFHIVSDDEKTIDAVKKSPTKENTDYMLMDVLKKDRYNPDKVIPDKDIEKVVIEKLPRMEGSRVIYAGSTRSDKGGYEIRLQFDPQGASEFEELTKNNIKKRMAIILDHVCYSAPTIQERIAGECRISGSFTQKEADDLSSVLTAGSLPAEVKEESTFIVGPALGQEQIDSGIHATLIGAVAVAVFMWFYYRLSGFISIVCLGVLLTVMLGALGFFKATMTLPGIGGILLNLGMAVDANVLIYERFREELARGRPLRQAIHQGFDRAHVVIIDSQLTTLIAGIILYYVGTGPVRGFAVTLSIGVLVTLFSNLWVCRQIYEWLLAKDALKSLNMMQLFKATNFDFMGTRKLWMTVSAVLILASIAGFAYMGPIKKKIYDVDFTGGTLVQFNLAPGLEQTDEEVKDAIVKTLKPNLKTRLQGIAEKLEQIAGAGLKGPEVKSRLAAELPAIEQVEFATVGEPAPEQLTALSGRIRKVLEDYEDSDLVAQTFGEGLPDQPQKHRSFTLTTRFTERSVVEALDAELMKTFAGNLEPPAVEVQGNALRLRLKPDTKIEYPVMKETIRLKLASLAATKGNENIQDLLRALTVSDKTDEGYGQGKALKRPCMDLAPLPLEAEKRGPLVEALATAKFKKDNVEFRSEGPISRKSAFGPQVASEMFVNAALALLGALASIFVYVWFRFMFSPAWGFGALAATLHDPTLCVGAACFVTATNLFPALINLDFIAAILTVIGYSVNDTIVVFDRIREVKTAHPTRALADIINDAVNATLSRTVLTSLTALITMVALLIFGGPTVRNLAFAMTVGIVVGTYSSIFIAAPLMLWWYQRYGEGRAPVPGQQRAASEDQSASKAKAQI